jgi:S-DNA-T family DNA segregation ATPase FtsK/SpoIIIE
MAYQTRSRDPLLDREMQAAIEKRAKELLGLLLVLAGAAAAAMVASYSPEDPNWMVSTDAPIRNWLGRPGAAIAAPLFMIVGAGAWAIPVIALIWGARLILHVGTDRAAGRVIFAPIAIAFVSAYAATLVPGADWQATHSFGLGGLFGDTLMGALLTLLPVGSHLGIKLMSAAMALATLWLGAFVVGFTWAEIGRFLRFCWRGLLFALMGVMAMIGRAVAAIFSRRREDVDADWQEEWDDEDDWIDEEDDAAPRRGLLARLPALLRRAPADLPDLPEPELVDPQRPDTDVEAPGEDRIRARIADVIRARRQGVTEEVAAEKPLTKGRGRGPEPLVLDTASGFDLPPEPPLRGAPTMQATPQPQAPSIEAPQPDDWDEAEDEGWSDADPVAMSGPLPVAEPRRVVQTPSRRNPAPSRRAQAEAQPALALEAEEASAFELPPLSLLTSPEGIQRHHLSRRGARGKRAHAGKRARRLRREGRDRLGPARPRGNDV